MTSRKEGEEGVSKNTICDFPEGVEDILVSITLTYNLKNHRKKIFWKFPKTLRITITYHFKHYFLIFTYNT